MLPDPFLDLRSGVWTLDELVDVANRLLPDYLPKETAGRVTESVNQRLVRHYGTLGLLPETRRDGREVRYLYPHLLRLLALRRLLAEGFSSQAIKRMFDGAADEELEAVLSGGVRVDLVPEREVDPAAERAAFLRRLRGSAGLAPLQEEPAAAAPPSPEAGPSSEADRSLGIASLKQRAPSFRRASPASREEQAVVVRQPQPEAEATPPASLGQATEWSRLELEPGLELLVREDYRFPAHSKGDEDLVQRIRLQLLQLEQRRKQRP